MSMFWRKCSLSFTLNVGLEFKKKTNLFSRLETAYFSCRFLVKLAK